MSRKQFYELSFYTLAHKNPRFIHQHIVDAFSAQTADENTKPIKTSFGLIGLCLYLERNFTGRQVQLAHMALANRNKSWPKLDLPKTRGEITVADVLSAAEGAERDEMIQRWCVSVWQAYRKSHQQVRDLISKYLLDS